MGLITPLDRYCDNCGREVDEGEYVIGLPAAPALRLCFPCARGTLRMSELDIQANTLWQIGITVHQDNAGKWLHAGNREVCSLCAPEIQRSYVHHSQETRYYMGRPVSIQRTFERYTQSDGAFTYRAQSGTVFMYLGSPWYKYPPAEYGKRSYYHSSMTVNVEPPF